MPDAPPPTRPPRISAKDRLKKLLEEYGAVAVVVFLTISGLTFVSIWMAIKVGWKPELPEIEAEPLAGIWRAITARWNPESALATAGPLLAAYIMYRFTIVLRILATLALTPVVARLLERLRLRTPRPPVS